MNVFNLIPAPINCEKNDGFFLLPFNVNFFCDDFFQNEFDRVLEFIKNNVTKKDFVFTQEKEDSCGILCILRDENIKGRDAYVLEITQEKIKISAASKDGAFYGLISLYQILLSAKRIEDGYFFDCCKICDSSEYEWRGFMLDTARTFFTVNFIKKLLDLAALHKLNRFHWHLTDDQGWRIPIPAYPKLTEIGSVQPDPRHLPRDFKIKKNQFYTHSQVKEIVSYAEKLHIMVIPEIETPGHASAILASYPELGCLGQGYGVEGRYGIFDEVLCVGNDKVLTVLDSVFETVSNLFPSPYIHIGGDECPSVRWKSCPKCQKRIKDQGLDNENQLQSWMTSKVTALVSKWGKIPIGWDEVIDNAEKVTLPKDLIVMSWRGTEGGVKAAELNHKFIMAPTTDGCYLDYPHLENEEEPGLQSCTTVKKSYEYSPIPKGFPKEKKDFVLGGQGNIWTELLHFSRWVEYMLFPRLCALSESLWLKEEQKDFDSFAERLKVHKERLAKLDVQYYNGALF